MMFLRLLVQGGSDLVHHRHWIDGRDEPPDGPIASEILGPAGTKRVVAAALIGLSLPTTSIRVGNGSIVYSCWSWGTSSVAPDGIQPRQVDGGCESQR